MTNITKAYVYKSLNNISKQHSIDVSKYIRLMVGADTIPYEVIVFINKYEPIEKLITYNEIYNKRRNSPLFRNIVRSDNSESEKAIILSSLLTQSLISIKHCQDEDNKEEVIDAINVDVIMNALQNYIHNNDTDALNDTFETFQIIFKTLFPKNSK